MNTPILTPPTRLDPETTALRDDLTELRRDLSVLMDHVKQIASKSFGNTVDGLEHRAQEVFRDARKGGAHAARDLGHQIESRPWLAASIGLGAAYLGYRVISRASHNHH